ncbi:MAG: histidinol-phosphate transaminase [Eubacteriales bacterium]|nr:histidinol-phosphate transaminase [Eubacteriales bacterium]
MSDFLRPALQALEPYIPGEQPQTKGYIKLNTNESPFPPSPKVLDALDREQVSQLNLYSDPTNMPLKRAIAEYYGLKREQVFVGNGSDEVLAFSFLAFADEEHPATMPEISYGFYPVFAKLFQVKPHFIPLNDDFTVPVEKFCGVGTTVVLANPNAPTAIGLSLEDVEKIVSSNREHVVLIDEAYVDFDGETALPLLKEYPNLLIVRTFSKSRNLAGARLGYALAGEALINDLERVRGSFHPYNINRLSMLAGIEAMKDSDYFARCRRQIVLQRTETAEELEKLGFQLTRSSANFLFVKPPLLSGGEYYQRLKEKGVLVRYFDSPKLREYVRVSIGSKEQMRQFLLKTREILLEVRS